MSLKNLAHHFTNFCAHQKTDDAQMVKILANDFENRRRGLTHREIVARISGDCRCQSTKHRDRPADILEFVQNFLPDTENLQFSCEILNILEFVHSQHFANENAFQLT